MASCLCNNFHSCLRFPLMEIQFEDMSELYQCPIENEIHMCYQCHINTSISRKCSIIFRKIQFVSLHAMTQDAAKEKRDEMIGQLSSLFFKLFHLEFQTCTGSKHINLRFKPTQQHPAVSLAISSIFQSMLLIANL